MTGAGRADTAPVVVGVTGHRDLAPDDPTLIALVGAELARLARANGHAPLLLLSGLAEGADRLAINAARAGAMDVRVWGIVPLPDALYMRDFATARSQADYRALKAACARVIAAPLMAPRRTLADYGEPRNHQYAWIGAYIARRAQILLALWDGAAARGTGGTAHVAGWFLAGSVPRAYRISEAPRIVARQGVASRLIQIDPRAHKVRRLTRAS